MSVSNQHRGNRNRRQPAVFISYARSEAQFASHLRDRLSAADIDVHWDMELPAGSSLSDVLKTSIDAADIVIVLISPDYFSSKWAQAELATALSAKKRVLPILVRPGEVEGPLAYYQHLDAIHNPSDAVERAVQFVETT